MSASLYVLAGLLLSRARGLLSVDRRWLHRGLRGIYDSRLVDEKVARWSQLQAPVRMSMALSTEHLLRYLSFDLGISSLVAGASLTGRGWCVFGPLWIASDLSLTAGISPNSALHVHDVDNR